ncbi:MAG TPA: GIY-YIG nuclease family protein [Candidatus Micrarchaeaceae archaeon]|nr:GIY-YIG nuclease family protein [Candidatus Micrarchaeaceae archaeon]
MEKSNWTGQGLICPRSSYATAKRREQFSKPGVYLLSGPNEAGDATRLYVGEGDELKERIDVHVVNKDFWTLLIAFVSKDQNLNKAHVKYLESRLCQIAKDAGRAVLDNGNVPAEPKLSEPDQAEMEVFLDQVLMILPLVGIDAFRLGQARATSAADRFTLSQDNVKALGAPDGDGFAVFKDSLAKKVATPAIPQTYSLLRSKLLEQGVLVENGDTLRFAKTYVFNSPSAAAAVSLGRSANGLLEWKAPSGKTLKQVETEKVASGTKELAREVAELSAESYPGEGIPKAKLD